MITALAAAILSASLLAWLPLRVSLTLAGLLTVFLLPLALMTARRSVPFAAMTLAMLGMMWRGETWKALCLKQSAQMYQLQRQYRQPSPKTVYFSQEASLPDDVLHFSDRVGRSDGADVRMQLRDSLRDQGKPLETRLTLRQYSFGNPENLVAARLTTSQDFMNYYTNAGLTPIDFI
jgi:hypothetical protein